MGRTAGNAREIGKGSRQGKEQKRRTAERRKRKRAKKGMDQEKS